jgi:hypothetical protein
VGEFDAKRFTKVIQRHATTTTANALEIRSSTKEKEGGEHCVNPGDWVICIDNDHQDHYLSIGSWYKVDNVKKTEGGTIFYNLFGVKGFVTAERFAKSDNVVGLVECVDDRFFEEHIQKGYVYGIASVRGVGEEMTYSLNGVDQSLRFHSSRFKAYTPAPINGWLDHNGKTLSGATNSGIKESSGKLSFELDWDFIEGMAKRMSKNKGKYPPYNWKKPIDTEKLIQPLIRHFVSVMKGEYEDDGDPVGHLHAIALNAMMLTYQIKNNGRGESKEEV